MIDRRKEGETAAFPLCMDASQDGPAFKNEGMSLRAYLAAHSDIPWNAVIETMALNGNTKPTVGQAIDQRAMMRIAEADAVIKQLEKETAWTQ